jgi:hypothetical protein
MLYIMMIEGKGTRMIMDRDAWRRHNQVILTDSTWFAHKKRHPRTRLLLLAHTVTITRSAWQRHKPQLIRRDPCILLQRFRGLARSGITFHGYGDWTRQTRPIPRHVAVTHRRRECFLSPAAFPWSDTRRQ